MITVIVPVYNAEKYIGRCIESVLSQTFSDFKLVLVDDGSRDESYNIIKDYCNKDTRLLLIHQENMGAGKARNTGIKYAEGKYTVFLDADDYIENYYFQELIGHNEDIVFINAKQLNENGKVIIEQLSKYKSSDKENIIRSQMTGKMPWGGWRKAIRTDLLKEKSIQYSEHNVGEEAIYSFKALFYAESYGFIEKPVYNYEVHKGSLSQTIQEDPWGNVAIALKDELIKMNCYEKYADTVNSFIFTAGIVSLSRLAKIYEFKKFKIESHKRLTKMEQQIDAHFAIDKEHLDVKAKIIGLLVKIKLFRMIYIISKMR